MINHLKGLEINSIYDFDNAFSINELLCKFWEKLEECVTISNEAIDILEWVKEQPINSVIQELITQLVEDGTIEQMINVDKIDELRTLINTHEEEITNKISNVSEQLDTIKSNHAIYNDRELKESNNYALDVANLVGQGLYEKGSSENNKFRCAVFHNYVDTEVLTIDNVGEMSSIFVRNARNPERRIDKDYNFIPKSNYLDFRQGFMDEDGVTHSFVQMFRMNYLGDMYFPNNRNDVATHKIYTVSEMLANKDYGFQIGSYYNTRYIARFDYENNKSALNIALDTSKANTQLLSPNMGLKLTANNGNAYLEALNGNVVLKGSNGAYVYKDGANLPIISMISNKPETSTSNGNKGDCFVDSTHLYICYETNKWIRIAKDSSW